MNRLWPLVKSKLQISVKSCAFLKIFFTYFSQKIKTNTLYVFSSHFSFLSDSSKPLNASSLQATLHESQPQSLVSRTCFIAALEIICQTKSRAKGTRCKTCIVLTPALACLALVKGRTALINLVAIGLSFHKNGAEDCRI